MYEKIELRPIVNVNIFCLKLMTFRQKFGTIIFILEVGVLWRNIQIIY